MQLGPWTCDVCGADTVDADNGYLIWEDAVNDGPWDFKIIHRDTCDRQSMGSSALDRMLGPDGLVHLTAWLSLGPIKAAMGQGKPVPPRDLDEFVDLVRRLHVPGYEQARERYRAPDVQEDYADAGESLPYLQESIAHLI